MTWGTLIFWCIIFHISRLAFKVLILLTCHSSSPHCIPDSPITPAAHYLVAHHTCGQTALPFRKVCFNSAGCWIILKLCVSLLPGCVVYGSSPTAAQRPPLTSLLYAQGLTCLPSLRGCQLQRRAVRLPSPVSRPHIVPAYLPFIISALFTGTFWQEQLRCTIYGNSSVRVRDYAWT